jgi:hypothetical protein
LPRENIFLIMNHLNLFFYHQYSQRSLLNSLPLLPCYSFLSPLKSDHSLDSCPIILLILLSKVLLMNPLISIAKSNACSK